MQFSVFAILSLLAPIISSTPILSRQTAVAPPLTYLFTAHVQVAKPFTLTIPVQGGIRIIEGVLGGNITGPGLTGTVSGGLVYPVIYVNHTLNEPTLNLYGTTSDGTPFFLTQSGIGTNGDQLSRIQIDIGGKYASLSSEFILAEVKNSETTGISVVTGYKVGPTS
ncbi:hypothetical protein MMC14_003051 [Varicellaria rhodocarpa]|nr:hypothetical protein [Varicellaria rhodocarpa]